MNRRFEGLASWLPEWDCGSCSRCTNGRPARLATIQSWFDRADGRIWWWCGCCGETYEVPTPAGPQCEEGMYFCDPCEAWMEKGAES